MNAQLITSNIGGLLATGFLTIALMFINFLSRRGDLPNKIQWLFRKLADVPRFFGAATSDAMLHYILGTFVCIITAFVVVHLAALYASRVDSEALKEIQSQQVWLFLGSIFNPFYVDKNGFVNSIGYAFLIVLWWFGMYSVTFAYRLGNRTPFSFGWHALLSVIYFAIGLAAMIGIQSCWNKFGIETYRSKLLFSFIGIAVGALLPPFLLKTPFLEIKP